jgi:hypothetical protein
MSIQAIPGVQFIPQTHRCYEYVLDFVIASAALGCYMNAYRNQPVTSFAPTFSGGDPQYPTCVFAGNASGKHLELIPHDIFTNIFVNDSRNGSIPYLSKPVFHSATGHSTGAVAETLEGFAQAMFTRYYENNLAAIEITFGKRRKNKWPSVLQFAAVVRDAMSHGGVIHMFPSVPPVTHFHLNYSMADNGMTLVHNDMTCADIFSLMLDMDAAF